MRLNERVAEHFQAHAEASAQTLPALAEPIATGAEMIVTSLLGGGKVLSCGNGGSAANAQHFTAKMLNGFERERPCLPAISLCTDTATLTSTAHNFSYQDVFARQLSALGHPGDILFAVSTAGNATNICAAIAVAAERQMKVIALTGRDGGRVAGMLRPGDLEIRVALDSKARIQEIHLLTIHCLCSLIDMQLLGN